LTLINILLVNDLIIIRGSAPNMNHDPHSIALFENS